MKSKKALVMFFTNESPALAYGLGSYTEHIKSVFLEEHKFDFICIKFSILVNKIEFNSDTGISTYIFPDNANQHHLCNDLINFFKNGLPINKYRNIICHLNFPIHYFIAIELKKYFNVSIIYTLHYMDWCIELGPNINNLKKIIESNSKNRIHKKFVLEKAMMQISDKICVATEYSKHILVNFYNLNETKIAIIPLPNSIPPCHKLSRDICQIRDSFNLEDSEKIILFVGRLDKNKNLDTLIKAFLDLQRDDVFLWIIGGGDYRTYLNEVSDSSWKKIHFWGYRDKSFISRALQVTDLGVVPSIYEEYGYVAVDFLCAGIPLIVNNTSGLAELAKNIPQICRFNDTSQSLNIALESFLKNYHRKVNPYDDTVIDNYSIDTFKLKILKVYNSLITDNGTIYGEKV